MSDGLHPKGHWALWIARMGIEADVDREKANVRFGARFCIDCGTVMPSVFAVLRLRSSSILLACWTGKSAGFVNCPTFKSGLEPRVSALATDERLATSSGGCDARPTDGGVSGERRSKSERRSGV